MADSQLLLPGEPAPWFIGRCTANPRFHFDTVAGRRVVLCFLHSAADQASGQILAELAAHRDAFDDDNLCFFGVSCDSQDEQQSRLVQQLPGIRYFWDFDQQISRLYGITPEGSTQGTVPSARRASFLLDERLRVVARISFDDPATHLRRVLAAAQTLPPLAAPSAATVQAPVLVLPRLFEPQLCDELIAFYERLGGRESGFMRDVEGRTVEVYDHGHKRRRDQEITDQPLREAAMHRIHDRLVPEIQKAFQFNATRIERHIVACYDANDQGHFRAHRDNTTKGTAHRRFAVSVNLNTGQYDGGLLRFPEFGRQTYQPPAGGAVVFSCSLLHEATPVTRGRRYAYLPFLYDEAAARIREQNLRFLDQPQKSQITEG